MVSVQTFVKAIRSRLPKPEAALPVLLVAALYTVCIAALLGPMWSSLGTEVLGDADTDTVRGMWGFEYLRRSLMPPDTPIWSSQVHFPEGVLALVLPWVSGILVSPLLAVAGPIAGYNLAIGALLWAAAMSTAVLAQTRTGSWVAGGTVGAAVATAPMLLAGVCDGTPEHISVWLIPLFFAAATALLRTPSVPLGLTSAILAGLIVLDSPYHGVYTLLIGAIVLPAELIGPWTPARKSAAIRGWAAALIGLLVVGAGLAALFRNFPIEAESDASTRMLLRMNAADLRTWWQYDVAGTVGRDASLAPTAIPVRLFWPMLALGVLGLPRSAPWLLSGVLCLALSFGLNDELPGQLGVWAGASGHKVGRVVYSFNTFMTDLPGFGSVRFPRRWMIPATMCFAVASADGIGNALRLLRKRTALRRALLLAGPLLVVVGTVGSVLAGRATSGVGASFPKHTLPDVEFANWIADHDASGAAVLLPQRRPAPKSGLRQDLPVFANLSDDLSSTDSLYLQVLMNRPIMGAPSLKTLAKMRTSTDIELLLRNWDDICLPQLAGRDIPKSAIDPQFGPQRRRVIQRLRQEGLSFVVVDEAAYGAAGVEVLAGQLAGALAETRHFDDGTGVTVFVLK